MSRVIVPGQFSLWSTNNLHYCTWKYFFLGQRIGNQLNFFLQHSQLSHHSSTNLYIHFNQLPIYLNVGLFLHYSDSFVCLSVILLLHCLVTMDFAFCLSIGNWFPPIYFILIFQKLFIHLKSVFFYINFKVIFQVTIPKTFSWNFGQNCFEFID